MVLHEGTNEIGDFWAGCPSEAFTILTLWPPEDIELTQEYRPRGLLPIEKATSLTLDKFYELYKDPAYTKYLQTSVSIKP